MPNESRLIDAVVLSQEIASLQVTIGGRPATWDEAKSSVLRIIDEQKTYDAVQAADLRERLKQYEDTGLTPEEVESIVGATLTTNERRLKLGFQAANDDFCNHFILHYPQGGDSSG